MDVHLLFYISSSYSEEDETVAWRLLRDKSDPLALPQTAGFPVCTSCLKFEAVIGCIDGTHIGLQRPSVDKHMYFNRKGYHSVNAMIMCDHTYKVLAINCQYGGAAHDSFVWRHSDQRRVLQERVEVNRRSNAWVLGDSGYPLEPWCITPYRNPADGSSESAFNDVH
ncbi:putative nuclease HARBI1 [Eurosta solidaginis]|uniref:putative nuclease HARBI1 n=1 Tax=Eurosta solidaginis TaxID=178769 RepID=UPI00353107AA